MSSRKSTCGSIFMLAKYRYQFRDISLVSYLNWRSDIKALIVYKQSLSNIRYNNC